MDVDKTNCSEIKNFSEFMSQNDHGRNFETYYDFGKRVNVHEIFIDGYRYLTEGLFLKNGKLKLTLFKPKLSSSAKLQWFTPNTEVQILEMAKVSGENQKVEHMKLLETLYNSGHMSPFQMCNICMKIETSREIARQIMRHWSIFCSGQLDVQELSQRYKTAGEKPSQELLKTIQSLCKSTELSDVTIYPFFYKELRLQSKKNRQASFSLDEIAVDTAKEDMDELIKMQRRFELSQYQLFIQSIINYEKFGETKVAREVNRVFFIESMTPTTFYMNGTIRSWIHYLQSRALKTTGIAQREHEELALKMLDIFRQICPCTHELIKEGRLKSFELRTDVMTNSDEKNDKDIQRTAFLEEPRTIIHAEYGFGSDVPIGLNQ